MKKLKIVASNQDLRSLAWVALACLFAVLLPFSTRSQSLSSGPNLLPGQSATRLADGNFLLIGGEGVAGGLNVALIWHPATGNTTQLAATLNRGRAWHSATMLPDGFVLILGGLANNKQIVATAELFDPVTQTFAALSSTGVSSRARHTVTLLTDGHLLIAGGVGDSGQTLQSAELWDAAGPSSTAVQSGITARRNHSATLLGDGRVLLWGGANATGSALENGDLFDPSTGLFTSLDTYPTALIPRSTDQPTLVASIPLDRSVDVDNESMISLRFSKPLRVETVNASTVSLSGPKGLEKITVVPVENGSLAFLTPEALLLPGATYTVSVNGAIDRDGLLLPLSGISFVTKALLGAAPPPSPLDSRAQPRLSTLPGLNEQSSRRRRLAVAR